MTKYYKFFTILFFKFSALLTAQEPFLRQYTVENGLPQQQVMCYYEDSRGFLWVGTKGGISRFDGKTFTNYNEEDGIPHNTVHDITEDENGNLWFATIVGLVCFDGVKFNVYRNEILGHVSMTVINRSKIFLYSKDWILWENGRFISRAEYFKGVDISDVRKVYYDKPTGNVYVCRGSKEVIYLYKDGKFVKVGPPNLDFSEIQRLNDGELFLGRYVGGFEKYEVFKQTSLGNFKLIYKKDNKGLELFEAFPYDFFTGHFLEKTQYYISKGQKGVFTPLKKPIPECMMELGSFYEIHCCDIAARVSENIWVSSAQGLWQVFNPDFKLISNNNLQNVSEIAEDKDHNLYFATKPILKYNGSKFEYLNDPILNQFPTFYFGASSDKNGNVYFPHHYGVLKYDGKAFSQLLGKPNPQSDRDYCESSYYDKMRNWLLTGMYRHVRVFDLNKNTNFVITQEQGLHKSEDTEGVLNDIDSTFWLFGKLGMTHWSPEKNSFKNYSIYNDKGVAFGGISGCVDSFGTLWIGNTFGLCYYDRLKDSFRWLSSELKHYFTSVTNYDKEHLILGTADGLVYLFDLKKWYVSREVSLKLYNYHNGYVGGKIQQGGIFKDSKGTFWVLSANGLFNLSSNKLNFNLPIKPKAYIKLVDSINLRLNHSSDTIYVAYSQNYFEVEAGLIFFPPSVKNYYSYCLIQANDTTSKWSEWTEQSKKLFTELSSGIYKLQIKVRPLGFEASEPNSIFIKIDLPLREEPWFKKSILILTTVLLLLLLIIVLRNLYLRRQLIKNTSLIRHLEIQTLQAQMNPHFIYNILGSMQNVIYQNDTEKAEFLLLRLSKLIRSFLEASVKGNNFQDMAIQNDTTLLDEIELLKLYIEFEQFVRKDKFSYDISVAENIDVENFTLPPIIIQPFVENAIKHGIFYKKGKGHLSLNFYKQDEDILICEIIDDGVGIEQARVIQEESIKSYKSLSTQLISDRIKRLNLIGYNIVIKIENRIEGGTKVHITFAYS